MDPAVDRRRSRRGARLAATQHAWAVPDPGGHRRRSRRRVDCRRNRLVADRAALRPVAAVHADADRRFEPCHRVGRARWPGAGAGNPRGTRSRQLPPVSRRPRRPVAATRSSRGRCRRLRPLDRSRHQCSRARPPPTPPRGTHQPLREKRRPENLPFNQKSLLFSNPSECFRTPGRLSPPSECFRTPVCAATTPMGC